MTNRVVHVLGSHGAGKSTLLQALARRDGGAYLADSQVYPKCPITILPNLKLVMPGRYIEPPPPAYGMDRVQSKAGQLALLDESLALWADAYAVLWEGAAMQHFGFQPEYEKRRVKIAYAWLNMPLATCFERILARGGKKREDMAGQGKSVVSKWRSVGYLVAKVRPRATVWEFDAVSHDPDVLAAQLNRRLSTLL